MNTIEYYAPWMHVLGLIFKHLAKENVDMQTWTEIGTELDCLVRRSHFRDDASYRLARTPAEIKYLSDIVKRALLPKVSQDPIIIARAVAALFIWRENNLQIDELAQECVKKTS